MKNYVITFIDKSFISLTAEEAAKTAQAWQKGGLVVIHGNMYATHQIISITRIDKQSEKDLCELRGIDPSTVKTIEDFLQAPNLLN